MWRENALKMLQTIEAKNLAIHMMRFDGCEAASDRYVYVSPHAPNTIYLCCLYTLFKCAICCLVNIWNEYMSELWVLHIVRIQCHSDYIPSPHPYTPHTLQQHDSLTDKWINLQFKFIRCGCMAGGGIHTLICGRELLTHVCGWVRRSKGWN